jgi:hypothetical protein
MKMVTLAFASIEELSEFLFTIQTSNFRVIQNQLCVVGNFTEAELELAEHAYHALVMQTA